MSTKRYSVVKITRNDSEEEVTVLGDFDRRDEAIGFAGLSFDSIMKDAPNSWFRVGVVDLDDDKPVHKPVLMMHSPCLGCPNRVETCKSMGICMGLSAERQGNADWAI